MTDGYLHNLELKNKSLRLGTMEIHISLATECIYLTFLENMKISWNTERIWSDETKTSLLVRWRSKSTNSTAKTSVNWECIVLRVMHQGERIRLFKRAEGTGEVIIIGGTMYDCGDYGEQCWLMRSLFICRNWAGEEYSSMITMQSTKKSRRSLERRHKLWSGQMCHHGPLSDLKWARSLKLHDKYVKLQKEYW